MDKETLESKKVWLEAELTNIRKQLDDLVVQNHRFSGAIGLVNDLIKELVSGESDKKGQDEPRQPKRTKAIRS